MLLLYNPEFHYCKVWPRVPVLFRMLLPCDPGFLHCTLCLCQECCQIPLGAIGNCLAHHSVSRKGRAATLAAVCWMCFHKWFKRTRATHFQRKPKPTKWGACVKSPLFGRHLPIPHAGTDQITTYSPSEVAVNCGDWNIDEVHAVNTQAATTSAITDISFGWKQAGFRLKWSVLLLTDLIYPQNLY